MIVQQLVIPEVKLILPTYFEDYRGYYCESYSKRTLEEHGINDEFIQDNHFFRSKEVPCEGFILKIIHMLKRNLFAVQREV